MKGEPKLYQILDELTIPFEYYEHPPAPTIEIARHYLEGYRCRELQEPVFLEPSPDPHHGFPSLRFFGVLSSKIGILPKSPFRG